MKIPFETEYREKYYALLEEVFDSNFLSEGMMVKHFESEFSQFVGGLDAVALSNCGIGLMSVLEGVGVVGKEVIVPSNTFMATASAARKAGAKVVYADCNRDDLCLSFEDMKKRVTPNTAAVVVVHIGGHIAFEIEQIAEFCQERGIALVEDCAHAHGGQWNGRSAGSWGVAGVYSFYATKTMPLGEGGMVVTKDPKMAEWVRKYRNYGKFEYEVPGINGRMNEVTAALGRVQLERLPMILAWKRSLAAKYDAIFPNRVCFPNGMVSGFYKYIVFESGVTEKTGAVFDQPCHVINKSGDELPNTDWVAANHACPPICYGWDGAELSIDDLRSRLLSG